MSLFGKLVKTAVNTAILPVAVAGDILNAPVTVMKKIDHFMGGEGKCKCEHCIRKNETFTERAIRTLKEEADD